MSRTVLSRLLFASFLAGGIVASPRTLLAQDLTLLRAVTQQRASLLHTLDVDLRVWEDPRPRQELDPLPPDVDPVARIRWATDRGRIFLEGSRGGSMDRLFHDGHKTVHLVPDPDDPTRIKWAFIGERPPNGDELGPIVLPELLGTADAFTLGDVETLLLSDGAGVDPAWNFPGATCEAAVVCRAQTPETATVHLGFDAHQGWALSVRHYEWPDGSFAVWVVDDWMTARSGLTGDEVSVPRRGHVVIHTIGKDKVLHQEFIVEVDRFELPGQVAGQQFVAAIPPGTEVWQDSEVPGQPARRMIAGGAAAIEQQAAEAARKADEAMAELRRTGVVFSARPQLRNWRWLFLLTGIVLVAGGLLWRRSQGG